MALPAAVKPGRVDWERDNLVNFLGELGDSGDASEEEWRDLLAELIINWWNAAKGETYVN